VEGKIIISGAEQDNRKRKSGLKASGKKHSCANYISFAVIYRWSRQKKLYLSLRMKNSVCIPVVTVGGIAVGRSLAVAITLGASGVMTGSRFIATRECLVHQKIKAERVARQENETTIFGKSVGP